MKKEKEIDIYRRVLKYPPFAVKKRKGSMEIIHHLDNGGKVIAKSPEYVTSVDAEKFFAAVYLARNIHHFSYKNIEVTGGEFHIADLRRLTGSNNDASMLQSLLRIKGLSITFVFGKSFLATGLLHEIIYDEKTGTITCLFNRTFYKLCREKGLTLNLHKYFGLSPTGKNLYSFLISNSANIFSENTLIERTAIQASRSDKARAILISALDELVCSSVIKGWTKEKKNGRWIYTIKRPMQEYSPAGGKLTPEISSKPKPINGLLKIAKMTHRNIPPIEGGWGKWGLKNPISPINT